MWFFFVVLLNTPRLLIFVLYACHILFDFRFIFLSHSVILRWFHYFPSYLPLQLLTPTPVHRLAFPNCFLLLFSCLFHLALSWRFLLLLYYCTCKTSSINIWFVLAAGLVENLTQVVLRQSFVIQHVRTWLVSCETWNFLVFIFFSSLCNQLVILDVNIFPLAASCYFVILVTKMHD